MALRDRRDVRQNQITVCQVYVATSKALAVMTPNPSISDFLEGLAVKLGPNDSLIQTQRKRQTMSSQNGWLKIAQKLRARLPMSLRWAYGKAKYHNRAFAKSLDWDWEKINYNRIALVNVLISKKQAPAYLEIGCASNSLFDSVPASAKIGVDPASGGTVRATSDEFFQGNKQLFDVVFIDGLHTYAQVRRDVINSIRFLKPGGYVALHDMLPCSWLEHHVPRINNDWTGDVWKVGFELAQSEGIDFKVIKIDHGVGVFRIIGEKPELLDLTKELQEKEFEYFYNNLGKLPLIEWQDFLKWLG